MNRKVKASVPKLNNRGGDLTKDWFVFYRFWNERIQKYEQIRIYKGFAAKKTKAARTRYANQLISELTYKLKNGFNPIEEKEQEVIFYDEIDYAKNTRLGGRNKRSNKTFNFWANKYLANLAQDISDTSYTTYQSKLRIFIKWLEKKKIEKADVSAITPKIIQDFFEYLIKDRKVGNSRQLYKEQISRVFDYTIKAGYIKFNPVKNIEILKRKPKPPRYFVESDLIKIKNYFLMHNPQMWLVARLIFYCYIRPKEIRFMKVGDIKFSEGIIHVRSEISKTGKDRYPVIPQHFLNELIEEGISEYPIHHFLVSIKGTPANKPLSKNYFNYHFVKMRKGLGIQREFKFYGFKHTGMIMQKKAGADSKDIQMQAGHESLDYTDKYINQMMPVESKHLKFNSPRI